MNTRLFTQMRNEWKSNLWLVVELLIVSVVGWYIVDLTYTRACNYWSPRGFDISHTYSLYVGELNSKSPDWKGEQTHEELRNDKLEFLERLKRRPEIEVAAIGLNSRPYNGNNSSMAISYRWDDTTLLQNNYYLVRRMVTPDFIKVFRYEGVNGETPEQLAELLSQNMILPSDNVFENYGINMSQLVGKEVYLFGDTLSPVRIGASLKNIRYHDYEDWMNQSVVENLEEINWGNEWVVRVKDNMDKDFIPNLMADANKSFRIGNLYLGGVTSLEDLRDNFQRSSTNTLRNYLTGMGFLMLNVFLGLFGTFWFRTQQRVCEMALRKAVGASGESIMRRLLSEGVVLLTIATIPALVIDYLLAYYGYNTWFRGGFLSWDRLAVCASITYLLLLIMIIAGILIPARRAMKVNPATALHDE